MERAKYGTVLRCRARRKTEQQNGLSEQFKLCGFSPVSWLRSFNNEV